MSNDPNAPITRLYNLGFVTTENNINGLYVPSCTAEQVAAIPREDLSPGGLIFDLTAEELLTYSAAGFWLPVLTAQSEMDFVNIMCETLTASSLITAEAIVAEDITVNNNITTGTLNAEDITVADLITAERINVERVVTGSVGSVSTGTILAESATLSHLLTAEKLRVKDCLSGMVPGNQISPIIKTLDVQAGTGALANMFGSALGGRFTLTAGVNPQTGGYICNFQLPADILPFANAAFSAVFTPGSESTATLNCYTLTSAPQGQFLLGVVGQLSQGTTYIWNYIIQTNQILD